MHIQSKILHMEIKSSYINRSDQKLNLIYREDDPLKDLDGKILQAVHAFCFFNAKLVVVYMRPKKDIGLHREEVLNWEKPMRKL